MLRGRYSVIIERCNYYLSSDFKEKINSSIEDLHSEIVDLFESLEETIEALDEQTNELKEEIEDTKDAIKDNEERLSELNQELLELIQERDECENAGDVFLKIFRLPIVLVEISKLESEKLVIEARIVSLKKDEIKLENCLIRQNIYVKNHKIKKNKIINSIKEEFKKTSRGIQDLYDKILKKSEKCRNLVETFINLSNLSTNVKVSYETFLCVSSEDLKYEIDNISSAGKAINADNSILEAKRRDFFSGQDAVYNKISIDVEENLHFINNVLNELSNIYCNLEKMYNILIEYDKICKI